MLAFIIFGTRGSERAVDGGDAFVDTCPACHQQRHFVEYEVVRYFTLYFIPIIPMGRVGDTYMKCAGCGSAFEVHRR